jgi:aminoglycoside phosphotransferase family enzyme/predicted kinase
VFDADSCPALSAGPPQGAGELTPGRQRLLVAALAARLGRDGIAVRHVETHISHVLLHGGLAYKIKKALATPYLDQSTLARRRAACAEEMRLNRRLAPATYLDVVPVTGSEARPELGGDGPVLEVAVRMRAFDEDGLWDRLAARGALRASDVDELATLLAGFHERAAVATAQGPWGTPAQVRPALCDSLRELLAPTVAAAGLRAVDRVALERLQRWEAEAFPRLQAAIAQRLAAGRVREGHGDLHLGNIAREDGHCLLFDGIEFDPGLRWIDVMSDVAFTAMDLQAHGLPALAHRFVNAYLEASGDHEGLRVLGYYLVHRALVRAKVELMRAGQTAGAGQEQALDAVRRYLHLALGFAMPRPRALFITHGLSGSGKTTLTQDLLETLGAPRVRADVERKRLGGLSALQPSGSPPGGGLYGAAMSQATYQRLFTAAAAALEGGWPVILDAGFLRLADRTAARRLAAAQGVPFVILHFEAPPALLRRRLCERAVRANDASEADGSVLALQLQMQEPLLPAERTLTQLVRASAASSAPHCLDWTPLLDRLRRAQQGNGLRHAAA